VQVQVLTRKCKWRPLVHLHVQIAARTGQILCGEVLAARGGAFARLQGAWVSDAPSSSSSRSGVAGCGLIGNRK